ncbi:hypothetical protein GPECTOR_3g423 [Gonium pectorale]|uniref:Uncharacterized protein n=1 Tax=Gonium pectorale TaxID=33097 RepID=A0A150GZD9_GONPE|nr:hypothetical protein GPECTOR_3g423 [Gonium pectorale]|eukprot:KXZ55287.1 hypothetical protein GPECTOR_3g423 [Gonium pectorale]
MESFEERRELMEALTEFMRQKGDDPRAVREVAQEGLKEFMLARGKDPDDPCDVMRFKGTLSMLRGR